ncbi:hypothetical protein [Pelodictyon phaeoclathratiforme]|jgi:hypothetical protein|uniref:Uncharacterized protein n=1 Tax=Pelodictyon phaeoclathratiforme (strain DSM 5477 / BU-1) TaxID=324925 RepID=B4SE40_PELPB|nr:hypothetical protein [Pelodictyon phaeoclathratiforme]ACF43031.1 conserved hypothetical protein [Pelodictyon phaeoclathratiforme BU-1]MBV5289227.1 hypothetical protein [Pelodictyon phaeoclathratiforme]
MQKSAAGMVMGLLLGGTFIGIALYLLFFPDISPAGMKEDLRLYALLTGAYGIWRLIRVWLVWRAGEEPYNDQDE